MLLVAPDPRLGISPERISRVRTLLDGLPTAPGVAVALPGGPDGELDALVLRPDGVLGLVPAASSRRNRVGVGVTTGQPSTPIGGAGGPSDAGAGPQELAASEIDRLLALADPTPTAPRQVVPIVDRRPPAGSRHEDPERTDEDTGVGVTTAARLVLTASAGPTVLDASEVRRLFTAWRLAEFLPDAADLHNAGFSDELPGGGPGREPSGATPSGATPSGPRSAQSGIAPSGSAPAGFASFGSVSPAPAGATSSGLTSSGPTPSGPRSGGPTSSGPTPGGPTSSGPTSSGPTSSGPGRSSGGGAASAVVPAARSAAASSPGGAPAPAGPPRTGVLPVGPDGVPEDEAAPRPPTSPIPVVDDRAPEPGPPAGPWAAPGPWPAPDAGSGPRRRRGRPTRRPELAAWFGTWRGLAVAAVATFAVALGVAVLVVRGVSPTTEDVAAQPVRVLDGVSWTQRVVATEPTCEGHAYGTAVQFLRERPCSRLDRSLWSGDVNGTPMVASVAAVRLHDAASASAFKSLVDSSGTGNVADLLREGRGFPGAPASLGNAGYGSALLGDTVVIAETAPSGSGSVGESTLDKIAKQALGLR
jgi:hypothetical protein